MTVRLEVSQFLKKARDPMRKDSGRSKSGLNAAERQQQAIQSSQEIAQSAVKSAQLIAQINQEAAQQMAQAFQEKVTELLKVKNPQEAFDLIQAQVLQDAAAQVTDYQARVAQVMKSNHQEISRLAESLIQQSKNDLIHFVNDATANAPAGSEPYVSVFKMAFSQALQNFELIKASTADSFANFEKSVENMSHFLDQDQTKSKPISKRHSKR
jgi:alanyl-tRNA synthetase